MDKGTCSATGTGDSDLPTGQAEDLTIPPEYMDSDATAGVISIRVKFRGAEDESALTGYKVGVFSRRRGRERPHGLQGRGAEDESALTGYKVGVLFVSSQ